jgi:tRNA(fMet)-specific endonuclease VapC
VVSLRFLLDANVLSEPLKLVPHPAVLAQVEEYRALSATASPVWNELVYGCRLLPQSKRRRTIEQYLWGTLAPVLSILSYDTRAAEHHAAERARLGLAGKTPPFVDGQIAAIAVTNDLTLVTRNEDDFEAFEGLRIQNWWKSRPPLL